MNDITFILTAVKDRMANVIYLQKHIPNLVIVWDEQRNAMETFRRAWRQYQDVPTIRIQDDIILCKDFVNKAKAIVAERPTDFIQFFSRSAKDEKLGSRYKSGGSWMMNQCYYLPPNSATRLTAFADAWGKYEQHPNGDDQLMAEWLQSEKARYWVQVPSLVNHLVTVSMIDKRRSKFRQSTTFFDPEYDGSPAAAK